MQPLQSLQVQTMQKVEEQPAQYMPREDVEERLAIARQLIMQ